MEKNGGIAKIELLIIAGSSGGLDVLMQVLPGLRAFDQPAIIIVLHRKAGENSSLIELLSSKTELRVKEAEEKEEILQNTIYVAPADYHLLVEKDYTLSLDYSEKINYSRPSIDSTLQTAAEVYGERLAALLLSGANSDGSEGLSIVKSNRGLAAVQDPLSALVPFMPQQALRKIKADYILDVESMSNFINRLN